MSHDPVRARLLDLPADVVHGPRPPPIVGDDHERGSSRRTLALVAASTLLLAAVGGAVLVDPWSGPPSPHPPSATPSNADAFRCVRDLGRAPPDDATVLWRDRPNGCPTGVLWFGDEGELLGDWDGGARYRIGESGDLVVLGDWDCDGDDTPGLYEPRTGDVHYFDAWPDDTPATVRTVETGVLDGRPRTQREPGCEEIVVEPPGGESAPRPEGSSR